MLLLFIVAFWLNLNRVCLFVIGVAVFVYVQNEK